MNFLNIRIPVLNMTMGAFLARVLLVLIVVVWTVPTFGLLISSLRNKNVLLTSGWWEALVTTRQSARAGTPELADILEEDSDFEFIQLENGEYTFVTSALRGSSDRTVISFGGIDLPGANSDSPVSELNAGETATLSDGSTLTIAEDGTMTWSSSTDALDAFRRPEGLSFNVLFALPDNAEAETDQRILQIYPPSVVYEIQGEEHVFTSNVFYNENGFVDNTRSIVSYGGSVLPENADVVYDEGSEFARSRVEDYAAGETVTLDDGSTFVLYEDGRYEWASSDPFTLEDDVDEVRFNYRVAIPPSFSLNNYVEVLTSEGIGSSFINTFTVTIPATIIPIAIAAFASYAFSWMEFPGRQLLFAIVVGLLVVPLQLSLIPLLKVYNFVGVSQTFPGIWLAHTGFGLPLAIYLLRNYIGGLPREIIESAKIDGASHFEIFVRLVLPLSIPALASFAIFQFLWVWNDLLVALVFLGKEQDVLTSSIRELLGSRGDNWEILTSAAFISMSVPLIVFFSLQRYFVRGLLAGSVKGG